MWQFKKLYGRKKFVAESGRKVAVKVTKMLKCGRGKLFLKIPNKTDENTVTSINYARFCKLFCLPFIMRVCKRCFKAYSTGTFLVGK
jgi:hypothetical protein